MTFKDAIKDLHLDIQSIKDAGGTIDGQILEEHRKKLIQKISGLAEDYKIKVRRERELKRKQIKDSLSSGFITKDHSRIEYRLVDEQTKQLEIDIDKQRDGKIKELLA